MSRHTVCTQKKQQDIMQVSKFLIKSGTLLIKFKKKIIPAIELRILSRHSGKYKAENDNASETESQGN